MKTRNISSESRMLARVGVHVDCRVEISSIMAGYHWIMHNHDDDINEPSCPHCHAKDSPKVYKLDIYTGYFYEYPGRKYKGKISKQEMKRMWGQKDFIANVLREREWYEKNYHLSNPMRYPELPTLPIANKRQKSVVCITRKWINNNRKKVCQ